MTDAFSRLDAVIADRVNADPESSWTARLLSEGAEKCAAKFGEEAFEAVIEAVRGDTERLKDEAADVVYHLAVMLAAHGLTLSDVGQVLDARSGVSGISEKAARTPK